MNTKLNRGTCFSFYTFVVTLTGVPVELFAAIDVRILMFLIDNRGV